MLVTSLSCLAILIENYCAIYTKVSNTTNGIVYSCKDNGKLYICSASSCEVYTD